MKRLISILIILLGSLVAKSHEFWLQSKKFKYNIGEEAKIEFLVGENFEGEPWNLKKNKIEHLTLHHLTKTTDLKNLIKPDEKDKLKFKFTEAGTHLISLQSGETSIELEA